MNGSSKYLEQLARVNRWYQRFERINKGIPHELPSENYLDEIFAFFLNCYHLKDWIIHDDNTGVDADEVREFFKNNADMSICRDLCNSIKHLELDYTPPSGIEMESLRSDYKLGLGGAQQIISIKYSIDTAMGTVDAFEVASNCVRDWKDFIDKYINDKATA